MKVQCPRIGTVTGIVRDEREGIRLAVEDYRAGLELKEVVKYGK